MSESKPRRKLAAILAADVVGFSRKMGENEDRTLSNLKICRAISVFDVDDFDMPEESIWEKFKRPWVEFSLQLKHLLWSK